MVSCQQARDNRLLRRLLLRRQRLRRCARASCPYVFERLSVEDARLNRLCRKLLLRHRRLRGIGVASPISNREVHCLGPFSFTCQYCEALFWEGERVKQCRMTVTNEFTMRCQGGKVRLPLLADTLIPLKGLMDYNGRTESRKFRDNIRAYNAMFSFTYLGANVDNAINKKSGPYVFRISGQTHHLIGSLLPMDGESPRFAQLYIYDTENEVDNRIRAFNLGDNGSGLEQSIVHALLVMFNDRNQIVKAFHMVRDRFKEDR